MRPTTFAFAAALLVVVALSGCQTQGAGPVSGQLEVVAAENFWGSIAAELGGSHVAVTSLLSDPNADPHEFTASSTDARAVAKANVLIANGAGYDSWFTNMVTASFGALPQTATVGTVIAAGDLPAGSNPHLWYDLAAVSGVASAITAQYIRLDPKDRLDYEAAARRFAASFAAVTSKAQAIAAAHHGQAVSSTESIFVPLAKSLGLDLVSPSSFMVAVAEGNDPPIPSVITFEQQLTSGAVHLLVFNTQTVTPITTQMQGLARAHHVNVVGVTETIQPPSDTYEHWMSGQLDAISAALGTGTR